MEKLCAYEHFRTEGFHGFESHGHSRADCRLPVAGSDYRAGHRCNHYFRRDRCAKRHCHGRVHQVLDADASTRLSRSVQFRRLGRHDLHFHGSRPYDVQHGGFLGRHSSGAHGAHGRNDRCYYLGNRMLAPGHSCLYDLVSQGLYEHEHKCG